jgi:hypothetical protein
VSVSKSALRKSSRPSGPPLRIPDGTAQIVDLPAALALEAWPRLWTGQRHDDRFFEIVDGTIAQGFDHRYLVLRDAAGVVRSIQPFFVCSQNLLQGIRGRMGALFSRLDRLAPGLAEFRTLMVGSPVGEGVLAAGPGDRAWCARMLVRALPHAARRLGATIIVLKEFSSDLRGDLAPFAHHGYARLASLPYVTLNLDFKNFDDHLATLSKNARKDFRRKFRAEKEHPPLSMEVVTDISSRLDDLYPLYLQVYERASLRFEKLTPEFFRRLGREMPDRARFFIWSMGGKPVGFYSCLLHDGILWIDYMGMDYGVALDLHLYFVMKRDALNWGCRNGVRKYCGGPLNYDPKLHLGCRLKPMDLYASHVNPLLNGILTRLSPWLSPARYEPILRRFPNAGEL